MEGETKMKHLDGDKCFIELNKVDCALITKYLEMGLDYARAKDLKGCQKDIVHYMAKFSSFYSQQVQEKPIAKPAGTYSPVHPEGAGKKMYESTAPSVDADSPIDLKGDERR